VELAMPELPLPVSKDSKVWLWFEYIASTHQLYI
jgi:hypothetical protein